MILCPETYPVILGLQPVDAATAADTCDSIHLENADGVMIIVAQDGSTSSTVTVLTIHEGATDAICKAGTNPLSASSSQSFMIWSNMDAGTNDTLVRQTDAVSYTMTTVASDLNLVVLYVPAAVLTDGMPYINVGTTGGDASNTISMTYVLDKARYKQVTPPTAVA